MFGAIGIPEASILLVVAGLLAFVYRAGFNSGYRRALERALLEKREEERRAD